MSYNGEWGSPPEGSSGESSRNGALNPPSSSSPSSAGGQRYHQNNWTGRLNPVHQGGWNNLPMPSQAQYSQYYGNNAQHPGMWDGAGLVRHSPMRMRSSSSSLAGALGGFSQYQEQASSDHFSDGSHFGRGSQARSSNPTQHPDAFHPATYVNDNQQDGRLAMLQRHHDEGAPPTQSICPGLNAEVSSPTSVTHSAATSLHQRSEVEPHVTASSSSNHVPSSSSRYIGPTTAASLPSGGDRTTEPNSSSNSGKQKDQKLKFKAADLLSNHTCPICFSPPTYATVTPCGHVMCGDCLFTAVKTTMERASYHGPAAERAKCPVCRAPIPGWDGKGKGVIGLNPRIFPTADSVPTLK